MLGHQCHPTACPCPTPPPGEEPSPACPSHLLLLNPADLLCLCSPAAFCLAPRLPLPARSRLPVKVLTDTLLSTACPRCSTAVPRPHLGKGLLEPWASASQPGLPTHTSTSSSPPQGLQKAEFIPLPAGTRLTRHGWVRRATPAPRGARRCQVASWSKEDPALSLCSPLKQRLHRSLWAPTGFSTPAQWKRWLRWQLPVKAGEWHQPQTPQLPQAQGSSAPSSTKRQRG